MVEYFGKQLMDSSSVKMAGRKAASLAACPQSFVEM